MFAKPDYVGSHVLECYQLIRCRVFDMDFLRRVAELAIAATIAAIGAQIVLSLLPITDAPQFILDNWGEPFFMINLYKGYGWFILAFDH